MSRRKLRYVPMNATLLRNGTNMSDGYTTNLIDLADVSEMREEDIAALSRMIAFARNSAEDLKLESTVYCLTMALQSLHQQLRHEAQDELNTHDKKEPAPARH
jgi:ABC-type Fe3+/spermidine/putrescine transport system ATPase subunit